MSASFRSFLSILVATICLAGGAPARAEDLDSGGKAPEPVAFTTEESSLADILEGSSGVRVATMCTNCNVAKVTMDGQSGTRWSSEFSDPQWLAVDLGEVIPIS